MKKTTKWLNSTFCFRISLIFVLLWLAISSATSLIFYFSFNTSEGIEDFIFKFSTWFFIIPAVIFFGLINAIPLIIEWVSKPLKPQEE